MVVLSFGHAPVYSSPNSVKRYSQVTKPKKVCTVSAIIRL